MIGDTALWIARCENPGGKPFWVLFDKKRKMMGMLGETKKQLYDRWVRKYGELTGSITRYKGIMRKSELAMTMASIMDPTKE